MFVLVGLGNPGGKYKNNRHNAGHMFIDFLKNLNLELKTFKTDCFMNQSGGFVKKIVGNMGINVENLIIAHDDLDIPLGKFKIQKGTGPKLHNGIESIENAVGTGDFWRIRIGVDARTIDNRIDGEAYVLQNFTNDELHIVQSLFPEIVKRLQTELHIQ